MKCSHPGHLLDGVGLNGGKSNVLQLLARHGRDEVQVIRLIQLIMEVLQCILKKVVFHRSTKMYIAFVN